MSMSIHGYLKKQNKSNETDSHFAKHRRGKRVGRKMTVSLPLVSRMLYMRY